MKTVLITGATSGFGKGLVRRLLESGHKVIATGRNLQSRPEILREERQKYPSQLIELNLDIASKSDLESIQSYFVNHQLDVLINNAGFAVFGPAEECTEEKIRKQFEVNFFGLVFLTQRLLPAIRKSQGHIINFSSVFGFMGFPLSSYYCASKFAVEGFSESLSYEMKPFGVRVTLVEPGAYRTNFNNSAEWGMGMSETSVYHRQIQNYIRLRQRFSSRPNPQNPEDVIEGVVRIVDKSHSGLNYTFGRDAFFIRVFRKVLPRTLFHKLTGRMFERIFAKELA